MLNPLSLEASPRTPIVVARGDGIGPEIMDACLEILAGAKAPIDVREVLLGERCYLAGHAAGIAPDSWEAIREAKVLLKAPMTTPQGKGYKSLNVTLRKSLGLYANVRPCRSYFPYVQTLHPRIDCVVVRENEEDLYAGIEHRQTNDVVQCLKLMSRSGCERIARYAFEYARAHGRERITCMTKDNIMKLTDGLFRSVFEEVGREYPDIRQDHSIIDIGAARLAARPESFDVILAPNLYGDILSDIAAELTGSVGLGGSSNIGEHCAMFEAVHGSAPDLAGKGRANPSGLLLSAVDMLTHIGAHDTARRIHDAWLCTLEDGIHTDDISSPSETKERVGTTRFTEAVVERLGERPRSLKPAAVQKKAAEGDSKITGTGTAQNASAKSSTRVEKRLVGIDIFLDATSEPQALASRIQGATKGDLSLQLITNRGTRVWPDGLSETRCVDHWRCRFKAKTSGASDTEPTEVRRSEVLALLACLDEADLDVIKTENLFTFDGERGYSLGQGEG